MLMPGRVGLVAVDCLALGLPMITTTFDRHAPEAEYLNGDVRVATEQLPGPFARAVVDLLGDHNRLRRMSRDAVALGTGLSVESMADAFVEPIIDLVGSRGPI
jgi:hypothetical protein